jgi:hypothetical protein
MAPEQAVLDQKKVEEFLGKAIQDVASSVSIARWRARGR